MPLFAGARDISLFEKLNEELINSVIQTEVYYYKLILDETDDNVYGEGIDKRYYAGVKLPSLIDRSDQNYVEEAYGVDLQQIAMFSFLRKAFTAKELVPEVGDIIEWDKAYFEIDSMVDNQIVGGKDPDYSLAGEMHGSSLSIICTTHMTRMSRLNIEDVRYGQGEPDYNFPAGI
tara:strand:+ start:2252 stop:2776 length:525 start_codon:yes stop_codon:yes gene_type:complete